jgi:hypothetical protein
MQNDLVSEHNLALGISSCGEVARALEDKSHPCHKVVHEQTKLIDVEIKRQRPEPWMGGLARANLLFVSSNPSINEDPYPLGEVFPTYEWSDYDSAEFFTKRCNPEENDVKVTFKKPGQPDFLTLCYDGEYRSGVSNPKRPQPTWKNTHDRAVELIGSNAHPHHNYAITEIVHCKSKDAKGVAEASSFCIEKWMEPIFTTSPAKVVVLLGSKVRDYYARPVLGAAEDFGSSKGYGDLSQKERAFRDVFVEMIGGVNRVFIFNWHPVHAGMRVLRRVYGDQLVEWLKDILEGKECIPEKKELHSKLESFFA